MVWAPESEFAGAKTGKCELDMISGQRLMHPPKFSLPLAIIVRLVLTELAFVAPPLARYQMCDSGEPDVGRHGQPSAYDVTSP